MAKAGAGIVPALTVSAASALSNISPASLRRLCKQGELAGATQLIDAYGNAYWLIPLTTMVAWKPREKGWPADSATRTDSWVPRP